MNVFWIVATLMLIIALAFLLPPLLRRRKNEPLGRDAVNVRIYQDQLTELKNDLAAGSLSADLFESADRDLQRNLLGDIVGAEDAARASHGVFTGRITALAVALAVPMLSIVLYLQIDHVRDNSFVAQMAPGAGDFSPQMMVQSLEQRLKEHPADGEGWLTLAHSYGVLERYTEARAAYAKALPLLDESADLLAGYAEVMVFSNPDRRIVGQPAELLQKALRLNPDHPKALWFAGMAAFQGEDYQSAVTIWRRLEKLIPDDVEGVEVIRQGIAEAEARAAQGAVAGRTP